MLRDAFPFVWNLICLSFRRLQTLLSEATLEKSLCCKKWIAQSLNICWLPIYKRWYFSLTEYIVGHVNLWLNISLDMSIFDWIYRWTCKFLTEYIVGHVNLWLNISLDMFIFKVFLNQHFMSNDFNCKRVRSMEINKRRHVGVLICWYFRDFHIFANLTFYTV